MGQNIAEVEESLRTSVKSNLLPGVVLASFNKDGRLVTRLLTGVAQTISRMC